MLACGELVAPALLIGALLIGRNRARILLPPIAVKPARQIAEIRSAGLRASGLDSLYFWLQAKPGATGTAARDRLAQANLGRCGWLLCFPEICRRAGLLRFPEIRHYFFFQKLP